MCWDHVIASEQEAALARPRPAAQPPAPLEQLPERPLAVETAAASASPAGA